MTIDDLSSKLSEYHGDVKRRLDMAEEEIREHRVAIHGIAGDDTCPGLNLEVQGLRAFRDHVRLGMGSLWAAILTGASIFFTRGK